MPGLVWGWLWSTDGEDERTCACCVALDGTLHPIDEDFDDHANGRCMPEPLDESDAGLSDAQIRDNHGYDQTGEEWFAEQDAAYQRETLGPTKYAAYKAGVISLHDLVGYTFDEWGSIPYEKTLAELGLERSA
jgi:hypothetical protein